MGGGRSRRIDSKAARWLAKHPDGVQLAYYADLFRRLTDDKPEPCHTYREPIRRLLKESEPCPTWPECSPVS